MQKRRYDKEKTTKKERLKTFLISKMDNSHFLPATTATRVRHKTDNIIPNPKCNEVERDRRCRMIKGLMSFSSIYVLQCYRRVSIKTSLHLSSSLLCRRSLPTFSRLLVSETRHELRRLTSPHT